MEKTTARTPKKPDRTESRAAARRAEPAPVTRVMRRKSGAVKPLLIGASIGAAVALSVAALGRSKARRRAHLVGALTRVALFGLARAIAGRDLRKVASSAVLESAKVVPV